jgi:toxin ParE1/3/4
MALEFSFHTLAERELNDAASYYQREQPGLGEAFLREVERGISFVLDHPEGAPRVYGSVRRKLLARFPYALLYERRDAEIRFLAVMNLKRRPFYWTERLEKK